MNQNRFDISRLKKDYNIKSLESVIARVHAGNTMLFLGSGFSLGSTNIRGTDLPLASDLSRQICELGNFESDEDLAYSADFYLKYFDRIPLISLLTDTFTITEVTSHHKTIARVNWRRVYTTNYDNCYELASAKTGHQVLPITLEHSPKQFFRNRDVCIHINGSIQLLNSDSLESSFKLSESSYTNSSAFDDSSWSYRFRKDLEICSQIVFIGYSLYDMDVRRLLVSNESIAQKTCFITREDVSNNEYHRLSSYGEVFPIGLAGFAKLVSENVPQALPRSLDYLAALQRETANFDAEYSDSDIRDFLLRGKVNPDFLLNSLTAARQPYAVERHHIQKSLDILDSTNVLVLHGAIANGKSVLARQIASRLLIEGKLVYTISDEEANYEGDIEALDSQNQIIYLLIDDFERYLDIVRYFSCTLGEKGRLILTERPHRYRRASKALSEFGVTVYSQNMDYLHDDEVNDLAKLLTNTGLWGELGGESHDSQIRYLTRNCESQISIVLMELLNAPHVLDRFQAAFSEILKFPETKKAVHAICLLQHIYPHACKMSLISTLAASNHVYSDDFDQRIMESGLFEVKGQHLTTRSSVFATFILKSLYKASYSIDQLVRVVGQLDRRYANLTYEEVEIYRSLMKFGTLAAILPERNKASSYIQFYERLKSEVPYVVRNPHYWLQYAMALMNINNLPDAERILETAYSRAKYYDDYDTTFIDNQFARLQLRKALEEPDQSISIRYFSEAHNILRREENDIYKFRQAELYLEYYRQRFNGLSRGNKVRVEHAIKDILSHFETYLYMEYGQDPPPFQLERVDGFRRAVADIISQRET